MLILYRCAALQQRDPKRFKCRRSVAEAGSIASGIIRKPQHCPINTMPTTIKYNDLTKSIAASPQYIS